MSDGTQDNGRHCPPPRQDPPLTHAEIRELRDMLEAERRVKWFWATARRVAVWLGAVFGALAITWDALVRAVRHMAGM